MQLREGETGWGKGNVPTHPADALPCAEATFLLACSWKGQFFPLFKKG